jgi:hypothetical protein
MKPFTHNLDHNINKILHFQTKISLRAKRTMSRKVTSQQLLTSYAAAIAMP